MKVEDALQGIISMIESGGLDRCHICGKEERGEMGIVGLMDENGRAHTETVCYECLEQMA